MTRILALVLTAFLPVTALAAGLSETSQDPLIRPAGDSELSEFLWINRPVVIFADSPADPRFKQQIQFLMDGEDMLLDRDVVVLTDTDPAAKSPIRQKLRPRGFMMVLIAKDGTVNLRKPLPRTVREISRSIDKMPMRLQEVEDRRVQ